MLKLKLKWKMTENKLKLIPNSTKVRFEVEVCVKLDKMKNVENTKKEKVKSAKKSKIAIKNTFCQISPCMHTL